MIAGKRIQSVRAALEQHLMRAPTSAEMAAAFEMSAEEYHALEKSATHGRSTSLDEMLDAGTFLVADDAGSADAACEQADMLKALLIVAARLDQRDQPGLDQIVELARARHARKHLPRDLAHQRRLFVDQRPDALAIERARDRQSGV